MGYTNGSAYTLTANLTGPATVADAQYYTDDVYTKVLTAAAKLKITDVTVESGGTMTVGPAGRASLVANSGGILTVSSGGTAYIANIVSKGSVEILNGGSGVFLTLAETGRLFVSSGGIVEKVNLNGTATVYAGGSAYGVTVSDGGRFLVSDGFTQDVNVLTGGNAVLSPRPARNTAKSTSCRSGAERRCLPPSCSAPAC